MIYKFRHQGSTEPYICGCYFLEPIRGVRKYLPQVKLEAHSTIISSISRTTLTQTFVNPDATNTLTEIRYTFPLFDGVSVVGFVCTIGDRVIKGVVKEKQKAREAYDAAISRGETASLFERLPDASDVFTTTVGNVPAGATIEVNITYLGELKHDAHVDGIRLTIPTRIAPRYGDYPVELASATPTSSGGIKITVDAQVPDGSHITSIQSPSHPIAVTLGRTSVAPNAEPSFQKASATLALSTAELEKDFVLQLVATNIGNPKAILELHPSIPNQRALMATLVPKFTFPAEKPEIVFLCDRSGSMGHDNKIQNLQAALRLFVKSLSVGTKFNICSFGTKFDFLWDRSRTYEQSTVNQAMRHIDTFSANYGGTEMYEPMEETFKRRYTDMNLEVFLLTDGEIWQQDRLMNLVNDEVKASKDTIRVFTLGIGSAVSHSLIEGVARAGNGFSQSAAAGENLSSKVVRMLKGAMFPHIKDRSLELKYEKSPVHSEDFSNDDFEIIEKVAALEVSSTGVLTSPLAVQEESQKAPISLFDDSINPNTETGNASQNAEDHHSHLPPLKCPKILQAPFSIPPLFPFNRSTFYLLLSADTIQSTLKSVIIRGSSVHGPVELEIPITTLEEKGETIHQLATKKAVTDLEEGRGWIFHAKTTDGQLLKEKYDGQFSDMVEREGVRLGVQYQVGGKWCSFVAVD
ncbi:von Willebrand factor type A domain-containing protein, partial [Pseudomassariella vexata]